MGTYSNLSPASYTYFDPASSGTSWDVWPTAGGKPSIGNRLCVRFNLSTSKIITRVSIKLGNAFHNAYANITVYASVTNYSGQQSGQTSQEGNATIYPDVMEDKTISLSGFNSFETDCFYITLRAGSTVGYSSLSVDVTYQDPPTPPEPSVTINSPNGYSFESGASITFSWTVSNATQNHANIQESSDNNTWSTIHRVSDGTTYWSTSASGIGNHYWRVEVYYGGDDYVYEPPIYSNTGTYSVTEPYVPPTPTPTPTPDPDEPPSIDSASATPVQPSAVTSNFSSVFLANVSQCKVEASISAGTYSLSSMVYFTYPEYQGQVTMHLENGRYVGTTPLALPNSTTITITAIDTGCYSTTETVNVTVTPYSPPSIVVQDLMRCDAQGDEDRSGKYYKFKIRATCSSVTGRNSVQNSITELTACTKNDPTHTLHDVLAYNNSGTSYISETEDLPNENLVYVIQFETTDSVGYSRLIEMSLSGRLRDVVFMRDTTHNTAHVGIGMTPAGHTSDTLQLATGGTIIIGGQDLIAWLQNALGGIDFPGWN